MQIGDLVRTSREKGYWRVHGIDTAQTPNMATVSRVYTDSGVRRRSKPQNMPVTQLYPPLPRLLNAHRDAVEKVKLLEAVIGEVEQVAP